MRILVLNVGSSSVKYSIFERGSFQLLSHGIAEEIGSEKSSLKHRVKQQGNSDIEYKEECNLKNFKQALSFILCVLTSTHDCPKDVKGLPPPVIKNLEEISIVGHRVVHGGEDFHEPVIVDETAMKRLQNLNELAPLHNPASVSAIKESTELFNKVPHVLVFDTSFHQTIPKHAFMYGLPYQCYEKKHLRKYGFHGTSHHYVSKRAAEKLGKPLEELKLISFHLGNGCSVCAINNGKSVDTSMGFTPLSGLLMGTRCGDIDPSVLFQMADAEGFSDLENFLNKKCGMLGICGSSDMREILEKSRGDDKGTKERSSLAIDMFCYAAKKYLGSYLAVLGGVDAIIFTAGIGEHSPEIRAKITRGLEIFGVEIKTEVNNSTTNPNEAVDISSSKGKVKILVIPTDEEKEIACQAVELVEKTK